MSKARTRGMTVKEKRALAAQERIDRENSEFMGNDPDPKPTDESSQDESVHESERDDEEDDAFALFAETPLKPKMSILRDESPRRESKLRDASPPEREAARRTSDIMGRYSAMYNPASASSSSYPGISTISSTIPSIPSTIPTISGYPYPIERTEGLMADLPPFVRSHDRSLSLLNQRRGHRSIITASMRTWDEIMTHPQLQQPKHLSGLHRSLMSVIKALNKFEELTTTINDQINICFHDEDQMDNDMIWSAEYIEEVTAWAVDQKQVYKARSDEIYVKETFHMPHNRYKTGTAHGILPEGASSKKKRVPPAVKFSKESTNESSDGAEEIYNPRHITTVVSDHTASAGRRMVKLPPVKVPNFDGNYADWENFDDMFSANVDRNESLSDTVKLTYLKSYLVGDAAKVLLSVKATDANYQRALKMVRDRFSNPRVIVNNHMHELFNLPTIKNDNGVELMAMIDTVRHGLFCIEQQGPQVQHWDQVMIYQITARLPYLVKEKWEYDSDGTDLQSLEELYKFMTRQARSTSHSGLFTKKKLNPKMAETMSYEINVAALAQKCQACNGSQHKHISECSAFVAKPNKDKYSLLRKMDMCYQCLEPGHRSNTCTAPRCSKCKGAHHVILHQERYTPRPQNNNYYQSQGNNPPANEADGPTTANNSACFELFREFGTVPSPISANLAIRTLNKNLGDNPGALATGNVIAVLPTVKLRLIDSSGNYMYIRALLDTGSQGNFITENVANRLALPRTKINVRINTMGGGSTKLSQSLVAIELKNEARNLMQGDRTTLLVEALVMKHITNNQPQANISCANSPMGIELADREFFKPARVEALLGIAMTNYLMIDGTIWVNGLKYQNTRLGYVASGVCEFETKNPALQDSVSNTICLSPNSEDMNVINTNVGDISRFWEIEDLPAPFDSHSMTQMRSGQIVKPLLTKDELSAQEHFDRTSVILPNGRFMVDLPFKEGAMPLGNSARQARKRFHNLEQFKLAKNPAHREQYVKTINESRQLGYLIAVPQHLLLLPDWLCYHMAHHPVFKDSTTTALRVVYDGSMPTTTGVSLNDTLLKGPKLQPNLYDQLIRMRKWEIVIIGDIAKMYLQVQLSPEAQNYHRIFWRASPDDPLEMLQATVLMFGVTSSGYHAIRVLNEAAEDCPCPIAKNAMKDHTYVDDTITGQDSIPAARELLDNIRNHLASKQLVIRKWCSNCPEIIADLPEDLRENKEAFTICDPDHTIKALGMKWLPMEDVYVFTVDHVEFGITKLRITKRQLLSDMSKIYDPMGFITPVVLKLKLLMQSSWMQKIEWDKVLPIEICEAFKEFRMKLVDLRKLRIARKLLPHVNPEFVELHVFCDASEKAYAACVYVRAGSGTDIKVTFLTSKSKVAPLKTQSIARLELCAMLLGAKLVCVAAGLLRSVGMVIRTIYGWTDSAVSLCWVNDESRRWLPFVGNRVSLIHQIMDENHWHHVGTLDNPADLASRGCEPNEIVENQQWWDGPHWLREFVMPTQPKHLNASDETVIKEQKEAVYTFQVTLEVYETVMSELLIPDQAMELAPYTEISCMACTSKARRVPNLESIDTTEEDHEIQRQKELVEEKVRQGKRKRLPVDWHPKDQDQIWNLHEISELPKMLRLMGYCFKFLSGFKSYRNSIIFGGIIPTPEGTTTIQQYRHKALQFLIRREQAKYYSREIEILAWDRRNKADVTDVSLKQLSASSKIVCLYPFLDEDDVLKVGGRLSQADFLTEDTKYPAIIPGESRLSKLIILSAHLKTMHGSVQMTMSFVRTSVWITGLRALVREHVGHCVRCFRVNSRRNTQLMGDLPRERVSPSPPFTFTGIDFSGHFTVKLGKEFTKAYLSVFVCFSTKAIHIELVSRMDAESCAAALRRFVARRGAPTRFFTDNGTNFVGARN